MTKATAPWREGLRELRHRGDDMLRHYQDLARTRVAEIGNRRDRFAIPGNSARLGKYVLDRDPDGRFRFTLQASNGHVIATSDAYESHASALNAIESMRRNAATLRIRDLTTDPSDLPK